MNPKLSVVIPCYNHGQFVQEALESVFAAGRNDIEVIVVDDGSTDPRTIQEMRTLSRDPRLTLIQQKNQGLAAARNNAISAAAADYLLPLDADNRIRPAYLEHGIAVLDAKPKIGVVYGDAEYFGARTGPWKVGPFDRERLLEWNYIDACAVIRREVWEKNGGYRGGMPVMGLEDWDFWLKTYANGWQFEYIPEVLFEYRVMPGSMIHRARAQAQATEEFIADHHGRLYRAIWMERQSVSRTTQHLLRLVRQRMRDRLIPAGLRARN